MSRISKLFISVSAMCCFSGCFTEKQQRTIITGKTMGTTYGVAVVSRKLDSATRVEQLREAVERELERLNKIFSTYDPNSELSRLNNQKKVNTPLKISSELFLVLDEGLKLHHLTGGTIDITVAPLVALWGFGPMAVKGQTPELPSEKQIANVLKRRFAEKVRLDSSGAVVKLDPDVMLDTNTLAKGYGVDAVSELLLDMGHKNHLVEIGGEAVAHGQDEDGKVWRIPLEMDKSQVVLLKNAAMASSGDYRHYYVKGGKRYIHIIDARTGHPVDNNVVSVTLIGSRCMRIDALARAVLILGEIEGMKLIASLPEIAAVMILREKENQLRMVKSANVNRWLLPAGEKL